MKRETAADIESGVEDPNEVLLMKTLIKNDPKVTEYYRVLFNRCDINHDGYVGINELKTFVENQEEQVVPPEVLNAIYSRFDRDGDQVLDFEEFIEMINSRVVTKTFHRIRSRYIKFVVMTPSSRMLELKSNPSKTGLYDDEFKCKKYTVGMLVLSAIQIILFYVNLRFQEDEKEGPIEQVLKFSSRRKLEMWRYVTHIFVHSSSVHLYPNVIMQILIGIPLEMVHSWRVLVIYVAGALGGCLAHSVIFPETDLVGGSGGFYAFYTAHIATVIINWAEMSQPVFHLILFGVITIFDPVYNYIIFDNSTTVSYIAHLGGSVVGLLLGVNILRNLKVTETEKIICRICLITYFSLMAVFIILSIVL